MIDTLQSYVWISSEREMQDFINSGYDIIYQDVNLYTIYDELSNCYNNDNLQRRIEEHFGYYGLSLLLQVNSMYYWIMQV